MLITFFISFNDKIKNEIINPYYYFINNNTKMTFNKYILDNNITFDDCANCIQFEDIINGRKGANIINKSNDLIPIVRTTTIYKQPCQQFSKIHYDLIKQIQLISNDNIQFNNALVEIYDNNYTSMKYHSDQSLDLDDNSFICLYSIYNDKSNDNNRCLKIQNKLTKEENEIILNNNSIILFSTETNKKYLHKIFLKNINNLNTKKWLGITFRLSKSFIKFINEIPYFTDNNVLYLASETEKKEFYKYKTLENKSIDFTYPIIYYTINPSDLLNS